MTSFSRQTLFKSRRQKNDTTVWDKSLYHCAKFWGTSDKALKVFFLRVQLESLLTLCVRMECLHSRSIYVITWEDTIHDVLKITILKILIYRQVQLLLASKMGRLDGRVLTKSVHKQFFICMSSCWWIAIGQRLSLRLSVHVSLFWTFVLRNQRNSFELQIKLSALIFNNSSRTRKEQSERGQPKRRSVVFVGQRNAVTWTLLAWRIVYTLMLDIIQPGKQNRRMEIMFYNNFALNRWPPTRAYSMSKELWICFAVIASWEVINQTFVFKNYFSTVSKRNSYVHCAFWSRICYWYVCMSKRPSDNMPRGVCVENILRGGRGSLNFST